MAGAGENMSKTTSFVWLFGCCVFPVDPQALFAKGVGAGAATGAEPNKLLLVVEGEGPRG